MSEIDFGLDGVRRNKALFDNTWYLSALLAAALVVVSWYLRLVETDVAPVIWGLAALGLAQYILNAQVARGDGRARLRRLTFVSQLSGTLWMTLAWHLFGGLEQPLFPLLALLPLIPAASILGYWQQQALTLALLAALLSGLVLNPDTNSFIAQRYGVDLLSAHPLPAWLPRSRSIFADVATSPAYDLMLTIALGVIICAVSSAARTVADMNARAAERVRALEYEAGRLQELTRQLITHAPTSEALVLSKSGRIINASDRFARTFGLSDAPGSFLLDAIEFAYPAVIKRLLLTGGEEIQGATVAGRAVVLRVCAEIMGDGDHQVAALNVDRCEDICWRGQVDAIEEPVFAINAGGEVAFLNRRARIVFGETAEGSPAMALFGEGSSRWWEIAPLESARRTLDRDGRRYLASIRRERLAESIGELSFVHLHEHEIETLHAAAAI
jgi:PAS domain-containing protein